MATLNITVDIPETAVCDPDEIRQKLIVYAQRLASQYAQPQRQAHAEAHGLYISERIRALETGFECGAPLSDDYKRELQEIRTARYR